MFKIYVTVKRILVKDYSEESDDFKRGWKKACDLFMLGIKKSTQYNEAILNKELKAQIKTLKKTVTKQQNELNRLNESLDDRAFINARPDKDFRTFSVEHDGGEFQIITNMTKQTFEWCLFNFTLRHSYKRLDECKSKLLMYINNKSSHNFKAFKDKKAYNRYLNGKT